MTRSLPILLTILLLGAVPLAPRSAGGGAPKAGGPGKPLSPQEALKHFRLDPGLRIELVAAEPEIRSPVAMAFDPRGRIWVVEMQDYPNGPAKGEKPRGRIRILEDRDGDGYYESATTFADNLLFANGLLLWKDGAIVTMAPHIVHLRDTDGDGQADRRDVLYEGFAAQNPQLRVSHPILGLDGWVYCANGLRGGKAVRHGDPNARPVDLGGMDFRFDPVTGQYEAISGMGQYGNTFDEWGNRFVCDNRHHLRHVVMESRYLKRNPYLAAPAVVQDVSVLEEGPLSSGGKVYPLSRNWTTSSLHEGRFTAACGVFVYAGALLGPKYHGAAFTCEPTGNLVHMEVLTPKGATFESRPARDKVEFLATPDDWFRPVFLTSGPDGALYVVDMYRAVIEHPEFMPPELQKRPDLALGRDRGRIWRVVPEKHVTKAIRPNLAKATTAALVQALAHAEPWWRTTAQRLLLEQGDPAAGKLLAGLGETSESPHARILAGWLLNRRDGLTDDILMRLLKDQHPRVREHALRLAEPRLATAGKWVDLAALGKNTQDPHDRFQLALSLGGLDTPEVPRLLGALACIDDTDPWMRLAVEASLPKHSLPILRESLRSRGDSPTDTPAGRAKLVRELAALVAARPDAAAYVEAFRLLTAQPAVLKWPGLAGLTEGLERRGATLASAAGALPPAERAGYADAIGPLLAEAGRRAADPQLTVDQRLLGLRLLGQAPWPLAKQALRPIIASESSAELRIAALRALAAHGDNEVPTLLLALWPGASPPIRREILEALLRRPDRITALLDAVEAKRVKTSEIDAVRTRQLVKNADAKIRARAQKLLQDNLPADRQAVLKEYQAALALKGDAKRGQEVFKKNCATCHRVNGIGTDVGPDIADTRTKTPAALLVDILLPNQAIDNNYINYLVTTRDGRVLTGILTAETATSLTLKRAEGQTDVVLRRDIEEIASTGVSLMPEGFERQVSVAEMADLIRFLKDWRYLDGSVPVER